MRINDYKDLKVVILCGGLGTRLLPLTKDTPKCLLPTPQKPFLDILINKILMQDSLSNFILCVGHLGDQITKHEFGSGIHIKKETELLGTAGTIKNLTKEINKNPVYVINGDTFCDVKLKEMYNYHIEKKAYITFVGSNNIDNYGNNNIIAVNTNKIIKYSDKGVNSEYKKYRSAGIYLASIGIFYDLMMGSYRSLEEDFFPEIIIKRRCFVYPTNKLILDIGTFNGYERAKKHFRHHKTRT